MASVLTYLAGNVVLGNWDNYRNTGHNYHLYEERPGRFVMLPWDMNSSLEQWANACEAELWEGYEREPPLAAVLLADRRFEAEYLGLVRQFPEGPGSYKSLAQGLARAARLLDGTLDPRQVEAVRQSMRERTDSLAAFLADHDSCPK